MEPIGFTRQSTTIAQSWNQFMDNRVLAYVRIGVAPVVSSYILETKRLYSFVFLSCHIVQALDFCLLFITLAVVFEFNF